MRRVLYILLFTLLFAPRLWAQSSLVFNHNEWFFGTIDEQAGVVEHTFVATNNSNQPALILDVIASCGCMKPQFKRQPIMPGESVDIVLRFNPLGQQGTIQRELSVYGERQQLIARLKVRGEVIPRKRTPEERFPYELSSQIRLTNNHLNFAELRIGERRCAKIGIRNHSGEVRNIEFRNKTNSGMLHIKAKSRLEPGEESEIELCYSLSEQERRYGSCEELFDIYVDGKREHVVLSTRGVIVDGARSGEVDSKALLDRNIIRFGELSERRDRASESLFLMNEGSKPLIVRCVESKSSIVTSLKGGEVIAPHSSLRVRVDFKPEGYDYGAMVESLSIITNDPKRPILKLRVAAIIVE